MERINDLLQTIREKITALGITQKKLGKYLALDQGNISRRLNGSKPFKLEDRFNIP